METNLLPFLKVFYYFYELQLPQDLTVQGTVQTWSRFLLEKITLKQAPKGKVSKEGNKRETEAQGRVVRYPKRNLQQVGCNLSPESLRTTWGPKTWEHPSSVSQTRQGWETLHQISLVHETHLAIVLFVHPELKTWKIRPLGITVQPLVWRLKGDQANSPGGLHGANGGILFPGSERC